MRLPMYQWFMEDNTEKCGFCDKVLKSSNDTEVGDTVQITVGRGNEFTETLDTNLFPQLDDTSITFKITEPLPYGTVQIYIDGKIYIFVISDTIGLDHYTLVSTVGDTYYYVVYADQITPGYSLEENLLAFLVEVIDANTSTISTYNGGTGVFTISNIFNPVYFNAENNVLNTITGTDTSYLDSYYMYYNTDSLCMFGVPVGENSFFSLVMNTMSAGIDYIITIPYTTEYSGFEYLITLTDGFTPTTFTGTFNYLNGSIILNYHAPTTSVYTITIEITERNGNTDGLCINSIAVDYIDSIETVKVEDCYGNLSDIDFTVTYYDDQAIVRMDTSLYYSSILPDVFRFIIEDQNNFKAISRWYELYDENNCEHQQYTKISWTHDCTFGELLYEHTLANELYFTGVLIKQGNELIDSVDNVTADGRKISIYKNTQEVYELRLHPYNMSTMRTIERIFDHSNVLIDGVAYNATDVFQTSEIDLGVYTGRVELYKDDSAVIVSKCCC